MGRTKPARIRGKRRHNPGRIIENIAAAAQHLCYDLTVKPGLREDCCDEQWAQDERTLGVRRYQP